MPFLRLVLWACWALLGAICLLMVSILVRRKVRNYERRKKDRCRAELEGELPQWIPAGGPPARWRTSGLRRGMLVEALAERIDLQGRECEQTGTCSLVGRGIDLPCVEEGRPCQGPSFFARLANEWGLVDRQMTAVRRAEGLGRARALLLLGRLRQPRTVTFLAGFLHNPDEDVRLAATRALGLVGSLEAAKPLLALLQERKLRISVPSIQRSLMSCCADRPEFLLPHIYSLKGERQSLLMRVLAELAKPELLPDLERLAGSDEPQMRAEVARALGRVGEDNCTELLLRLARDPVWYVRVRALRGLASVGEWGTLDALLEGLDSHHRDVRQAAAETLAQKPLPLDELLPAARSRLTPAGWGALLGELGRTGLFWVLCQQLGSPSEPVRRMSENWLRAALEAGVTGSVLDTLGHPNPAIVENVADFLARWGDPRLLRRIDQLIVESPPWSPRQQRLARMREQLAARVGT